MKKPNPLKSLLLPLVILCAAAGPSLVHADDGIDILAEGRGWRFFGGTEFPPGGSGTFTIGQENEKQVAVLEYDFANGGVYVTGVGDVKIPDGPTDLRFKVKSDEPATIGIRLVDKTGQAHQSTFEYTETGDWQTFRVDLQERAGLVFGGANDKTIHYPLTQVRLFLQKKGGYDAGKVTFGDVLLK